MLEKQTIVDLIEVVENGTLNVRTCTRIIEDGKQLSSALHRHVVAPGEDYSAEDVKVQAICAVVHTPEVVAAYQAVKETAQLPTLE
jgi:hypothetical protein